MKKIIVVVVAVVLLSLSFVLVGCTQKKAESSKDAIESAKSMQTMEEKAQYLIGEAKAFYNSKKFQDAVDVAQYILRYVDKDSQEAKNLLEKAKNELAAAAKGAIDDIANKGLDFGK